MPAFNFTFQKAYPEFPTDWEDNPEDRWFLTHDGYIRQNFYYRATIDEEDDFTPTPGRTFRVARPTFDWLDGTHGVDYRVDSFNGGPAYAKFYFTGTRPSDGAEVLVAVAQFVERAAGVVGGSTILALQPGLSDPIGDLTGRLRRPGLEVGSSWAIPGSTPMDIDPENAGKPFHVVQELTLIYASFIDETSDGPLTPPDPATGNMTRLVADTDLMPPAALTFVAPTRFGYIGRPQTP